MVLDLVQPMFKCPLCDAPLWHSRMMFWKHIHECLQNTPQGQEVRVSVLTNKEEVSTTKLHNH
jgi:hypothetical protein